jgi:lipopolysaccharide biosynthesis glycosyltransferase
MKMIDVAYTFDDGRWKTAVVSIISMLANRGNCHYFVHCIVPPKLFKQKNILKQMQSAVKNIDAKSELEFVEFNYDKATVPLHHGMAYGGGICYYKQDLFQLLPDLDRVIYFDDDTVILRPLDELANIDLGDNYMLVFAPGNAFRLTSDRKKYKNMTTFNAGSVVFNLKAIRESKVYASFADIIKNKDLFFEQGLMAVAFQGKIAKYDGNKTLYNYRTHCDHNPENKEIAVIHFTGKKPWFFITRYMRIWWKYAKMSPFYTEFKANWWHDFLLYLGVMFLPTKKLRHRIRRKYFRT